jgi:hypothetical protein
VVKEGFRVTYSEALLQLRVTGTTMSVSIIRLKPMTLRGTPVVGPSTRHCEKRAPFGGQSVLRAKGNVDGLAVEGLAGAGSGVRAPAVRRDGGARTLLWSRTSMITQSLP